MELRFRQEFSELQSSAGLGNITGGWSVRVVIIYPASQRYEINSTIQIRIFTESWVLMAHETSLYDVLNICNRYKQNLFCD